MGTGLPLAKLTGVQGWTHDIAEIGGAFAEEMGDGISGRSQEESLTIFKKLFHNPTP